MNKLNKWSFPHVKLHKWKCVPVSVVTCLAGLVAGVRCVLLGTAVCKVAWMFLSPCITALLCICFGKVWAKWLWQSNQLNRQLRHSFGSQWDNADAHAHMQTPRKPHRLVFAAQVHSGKTAYRNAKHTCTLKHTHTYVHTCEWRGAERIRMTNEWAKRPVHAWEETKSRKQLEMRKKCNTERVTVVEERVYCMT